MTDEERVEMVEAVARAMCVAEGLNPNWTHAEPGYPPEWQRLPRMSQANAAVDALAPLIAARERAAAEAMREAAARASMSCPDCVWGPWCAETIRALPLPGTKSAHPETDAT